MAISEKEVIKKMLEENSEPLMRAKILEQYYQSQYISDKTYENILGKTQAQKKELEKIVDFLERQLTQAEDTGIIK